MSRPATEHGKHHDAQQGASEKTGPTAAASGSSPTSRQTEVGSNDVATVRVPGASMAEQRGPGFAATLLGLPGPEQQAIEAALASVRGAAATDMLGAGRSRTAGDARDGAKPGQNTPLPVEGEATERSLLSTDDVRRRWQRTSGEEKRITEVVDVVPRARPVGVKAAVVIAGGLVAIGAVIFLGSLRKPKHGPPPPTPALGARLAAPVGDETPPPVPRPATEEPARPADEPALAGGGPVAVPPTSEAAPAAAPPTARRPTAHEEPAPAIAPPPAAAEADHEPAGVDSAGAASVRDAVTTGEGKRNGPHRSDTVRVESKTRRRVSEGRGVRAAGLTETAEPARTRVAQPSRAPETDPDGTLPLGIR